MTAIIKKALTLHCQMKIKFHVPPPTGNVETIDARETAPRAASKNMFENEKKYNTNKGKPTMKNISQNLTTMMISHLQDSC